MADTAAAITGASSGIGKVFAEKLAARGHNLILIARRKDRLDTIAAEIRRTYSVVVEILQADLACERDTDAVFEHLQSQKDIAILVNNAGFGTMGTLVEAEYQGQIDMITVHVMATVKLTRAVLPAMIENRRGTIINVSSVAAFFSAPESVNYCATKAFLNTFSRAVHEEVRHHGITVQALCPGFTHTGFHATETIKGFDKDGIPKRMWMSADFVVETSLKDAAKGKPISIPGWRYKLIVFLWQNRLVKALLLPLIHAKKRRLRKTPKTS